MTFSGHTGYGLLFSFLNRTQGSTTAPDSPLSRAQGLNHSAVPSPLPQGEGQGEGEDDG
ncbi:hypothetical protein MS5786_18710 [Klebsiella pneumoniae]|nr:hypothetical protein KpCCI2_08960 [Klebsiella pneumoniae]GKJ37682.1 hypothetical protein NUBL13789_26580 [Klebsiella pneumoniae]GKJ77926.1 hypothetical protein NUBL13791_25220 [Klebsiella pneumoniae]GKK39894.1 hypothetical protein NUBL13794_27280 [Klebsiella pneumoniae]GKL26435.1 hypothetical protein NUBL13798_28030 [Klebsiella pneumoniae]